MAGSRVSLLRRAAHALGLHGWEYKDINTVERDGQKNVVTYARCRFDFCKTNREWSVVNVDRIPRGGW